MVSYMTNAQAAPATRPDRPLDQVIGENIHRLMWRAGDNQSQLAPQWGMTQASLSLKLRGKRPWFAHEIDAAARHYRVTRDSLFTRLPDLDSNQEPIGSKPAAEPREVVDILTERQKKIDAHNAVHRTSDATKNGSMGA